ncbi:response regulator [Capilliphycus salinus ALCB114379]|uniref:hybrid sensor histidine kinase/response regulator n=1 Tax=Capilliphycus salinus TaxID=2768948 RepID=UPI0039A529B0
MTGEKILIVDDEPNNFDIIEAQLLREKYELSYASSGIKALQRLPLFQPDVILLDVMMPDMDGVEVCQKIKSDPLWSHIPIVAVTALNSKQDMARCLEGGADDFISKPVGGIELRARIRSMLRIKQQYDTLQKQRDALAEMLKLREEMSHMIVHDLRNPIACIIFAGELLKEENTLSELNQKKVERIVNCGHRLQALTNDLLVMAKLESGHLVLHRNTINFCQLAHQTIVDFEPIASQKKIILVPEIPLTRKAVDLDANLFRRVLDNLLSNAIKFSPNNSVVRLRVEYPKNGPIQVRVRISDQGHGVSKELQEIIFQKYAVGSLVEGIEQIGLGLAFCKMIVEAHGGQIFVEDNQPKGATFILEI